MKLFSNRAKLISLQREGGFPALDSRPFIRRIFREGHADISWVRFSSMDCQGVAPPDSDLGSCAVPRLLSTWTRGRRGPQRCCPGLWRPEAWIQGVGRPSSLPGPQGRVPCFFQLLVAQHSLAGVHITPVSASVISWPCRLCICVLSSSVSYRDTCRWI